MSLGHVHCALNGQHAVPREPCWMQYAICSSDIIAVRPVKWPQPENLGGRPGDDGSPEGAILAHYGPNLQGEDFFLFLFLRFTIGFK